MPQHLSTAKTTHGFGPLNTTGSIQLKPTRKRVLLRIRRTNTLQDLQRLRLTTTPSPPIRRRWLGELRAPTALIPVWNPRWSGRGQIEDYGYGAGGTRIYIYNTWVHSLYRMHPGQLGSLVRPTSRANQKPTCCLPSTCAGPPYLPLPRPPTIPHPPFKSPPPGRHPTAPVDPAPQRASWIETTC
jgi:hypothetical protein